MGEEEEGDIKRVIYGLLFFFSYSILLRLCLFSLFSSFIQLDYLNCVDPIHAAEIDGGGVWC